MKNTPDIEVKKCWVVQRWVKFNPELSKNYCSNCFFNEKITLLIQYCFDFPWKKIVDNPKFTDLIICVRLETRASFKNLTLGYANRLLNNWALVWHI